MFKKTLLSNIDSRSDIKYNPPLSYRHMRIFAWIMMILMMLSFVFSWIGNIYAKNDTLTAPANFTLAGDITGYFGQLAIPFFLLANFAVIISSRENIKKLVLFHGSMALLIIGLYILCYDRYVVGLGNMIFSFFGIPNGKILTDFFMRMYFTKYLSINVFIDLLMCSLMYLFLVYEPKRIKKEKLIYYRLLIIIPILYELASMLVKGLSMGADLFTLPIEVIPLLSSKPIVTFLGFIAILVYYKYQKKIYLKLGGNPEQYEAYLDSRAHSFQLGVVIAITFAVAGIVDLIITAILMAVLASDSGIVLNSYGSFKQILNIVTPWGFGKGISLMVISPIALLFNYRKTYSLKSAKYDSIIPLVGIVICALILLEGVYQTLTL